MKILVAVFLLASVARAASIRDTDFKNFTYPLPDDLEGVPGDLRWMHLKKPSRLILQDGKHKFCTEQVCPCAELNTVDFGNINGLPGTSAVVRVWYFTGGTANWQYLYVIAFRSGKPEVMAWLETGSRAVTGLRQVAFDHGDLILIANDPENRQGECCSTGSISYRYRWSVGRFRQIGKPVRADDPTR